MIDLLLTDADVTVSGGDLQRVEGNEATRQRLIQKLRLFSGEWFLDTRAGVPWFEQILGTKSPRGEIVRQIIKRVIDRDPEVQRVTRFDVGYEGTDRTLTVTFVAVLTNGDTMEVALPVVV